MARTVSKPLAKLAKIVAAPIQSIIEGRRHQMFPVLEPAETERVRRFGKVRSYSASEALATVGQVRPGLSVIAPSGGVRNPA